MKTENPTKDIFKQKKENENERWCFYF